MKLLRDKRFRYGTFSTVMMLAAAVIFVLVNLLAGRFDRSADLTREQLFSLTEQSRDFIAGLEQDVTITYLIGVGDELPGILAQVTRITRHLLTEYDAASPHINVEIRDPMLNPALVNRLAAAADMAEGGIHAHSIVVESGGQIRVVTPWDMGEYMINPFTMEVLRITQFNIEREITRAVFAVTSGPAAVVYYVTGSGEFPISPQFVAFLEASNIEMREANLSMEEIPDTADILFIPMPLRDWSELKAERIYNFLKDEGRAFISLGPKLREMPNFDGVLDAYGLQLTTNIIIETDAGLALAGNEYKMPRVNHHEITENLFVRGFVNILPFFAPELREQSLRRVTLDFAELWNTSGEAYSRSPLTEAETLARHPDDTDGPFPLALAVTDRIFIDGSEYITRLVVTATSITMDGHDFLSPRIATFAGEGNWQFVANSLLWLQGRPSGIFVPPRNPPGTAPLTVTEGQSNVLGGIAWGGLPLLCIGIGVAVWLKRRHS